MHTICLPHWQTSLLQIPHMEIYHVEPITEKPASSTYMCHIHLDLICAAILLQNNPLHNE